MRLKLAHPAAHTALQVFFFLLSLWEENMADAHTQSWQRPAHSVSMSPHGVERPEQLLLQLIADLLRAWYLSDCLAQGGCH